MAHYAFLNEHNIVTQVIVGKDEWEDNINWEAHYGEVLGQVCKRTSYNTFVGVHTAGGTPFRKNYAGIGHSYNEVLDAFIAPKPFESWILNEETCQYEAPVAVPEFNSVTQAISWDEANTQWIIKDLV